MTPDDEVLQQAEQWLGDGRRVALATVIKTWGSAPRPAGSRLAVRDDGAFVGSISGGCVEGSVIDAAVETIGDRKARQLHFGISDDTAWSVGLACGGKIDIFVEPIE